MGRDPVTPFFNRIDLRKFFFLKNNSDKNVYRMKL